MDVPHSDHIVCANAGSSSRGRFTICEFGETDHQPGKMRVSRWPPRSRLGIFGPMNEPAPHPRPLKPLRSE